MLYARELHNAAPRLPIRIPDHSEKFKFAALRGVRAFDYRSPVRATSGPTIPTFLIAHSRDVLPTIALVDAIIASFAIR